MSDLRKAAIYIVPEQLTPAELADSSNVEGNSIQLDGPYAGLCAGQTVIVSGMRADLTGVTAAEAAVIADVTLAGGFTTLTLVGDLTNPYVRDTVSVNANVALATNGETSSEIFGNGDASQRYRQFQLKQSPLTYVSSASPSGADTTLQVFVNDLRWREVPSLLDAGPRDRVFVTRTSDEGKTTIEFGDGSAGVRVPTGQQNVRALYRKGIGTGGDVKAGQLSLLLTRPLGVKAVINPSAASGGADSEKLDDARTNAPVTVLTLDRVVSLRDYEDFVRSFAGIAKALATWTWDGQTRGVFVTVAGPSGAEIPTGSKTLTNLIAAMQAFGDPYVPLRVQTFRPAFFRLSALLVINPDYQLDKVIAAATDALRTAFSFDARRFGQGVALSEVMAGLQAVPGVDAVDVTKLYRVGDAAELNARLPAAMPQAGAEGTVQAAELLILDPSPIDLGVMS
jgi:predicted phage baseplate assembly protein